MNAPSDRTRLDGDDLREMFSAALGLLERHAPTLNALNVFPVPDGDTGTNMVLTLREVVAAAEEVQGASASPMAAAMSRGALMGARGNSGVILSQFFKGISLGLDGADDFGTAELAVALELAREHAYNAVGKPVEGTLLTAISSVARAADDSAAGGSSVHQTFDAICEAAAKAVALTPTMLPVLREAGVVDAGAHGLSVILEGARRHIHGEDVSSAEVPLPEAVGPGALGELGAAAVVAEEFLEATEDELYGYCTQFLVEGHDLDPDAVRETLRSMALSTVVVGDAAMVKVHAHAHDPGPVISLGASLGSLSQVKIESMDEQHREYSAARRQESVAAEEEALLGLLLADEEPSVAPIAVIVVAWGDGLEAVFTDLGVSHVLVAGDTMNPSVRDIVAAVESTRSDSVIFLPNNGNIVPAAQQAAEVCDKPLRVVPSATIPEGIAAMMAFNVESDLDRNVAEMAGILSTVRTGEICKAVREVQLNGVAVREGQLIGLLDRELKAAGDEPNAVLMSLLEAAEVSPGDLVTLYSGSPLPATAATVVRSAVEAAYPEIEVELVSGGQPHYHYIVSIE